MPGRSFWTPARAPGDGPEVRHVLAVAPDVSPSPCRPGNTSAINSYPTLPSPATRLWRRKRTSRSTRSKAGKVVDYFQKGLFRKVNNQRTKVGLLSPDGKWVFIERATKGQLLDETVVDVPEAYTLVSTDDANYAKPRSPAKVFRKGKPNGYSQPLPFLYTISLKMPALLKERRDVHDPFRGREHVQGDRR